MNNEANWIEKVVSRSDQTAVRGGSVGEAGYVGQLTAGMDDLQFDTLGDAQEFVDALVERYSLPAIKVRRARLPGRVRGRYTYLRNLVEMSNNLPLTLHTLAHEVAHAVAFEKYQHTRHGRQFKSSLTNIMVHLYRKMGRRLPLENSRHAVKPEVRSGLRVGARIRIQGVTGTVRKIMRTRFEFESDRDGKMYIGQMRGIEEVLPA